MGWNIFKIKIPNGETKEITEVESFTVSWGVHVGHCEIDRHHKVFLLKGEAEEFQVRVEQAAKLVGAMISSIKTYKN